MEPGSNKVFNFYFFQTSKFKKKRLENFPTKKGNKGPDPPTHLLGKKRVQKGSGSGFNEGFIEKSIVLVEALLPS